MAGSPSKKYAKVITQRRVAYLVDMAQDQLPDPSAVVMKPGK